MSKEESQFGFKDEQKAKETLELLKSHDEKYQKLTVRGLLGRAKRVLTLTKAPEKIANIKAAMAVFDDWLEENAAPTQNSKTEPASGNDKVPGLGFKDVEAAELTIKNLEDRDPSYQKLAVEGLIKSSVRVISITKSEEKLKCIKDGVKILEEFLDDFVRENRGQLNMSYLSVDMIKDSIKKTGYKLSKLEGKFLDAYEVKAKGNYKNLRTLYSEDEVSWDIVRNRNLNQLVKESKLFNDNGEPTKEHLQRIVWGYSKSESKLKSYLTKRSTDDADVGDSKRKRK